MLKTDYSKLCLQNKKNLELLVEQQMHFPHNDEYSSDECESLQDIFIRESVVLFYENETITLPKEILELETLNGFFSESDFTQDETARLIELLPVPQPSLFRDLLRGDVSMHFGPPLELFLVKLKTGYFTKNHQKCVEIDRQLGNNLMNEYYLTQAETFNKDPNRIPNTLKRWRRVQITRPQLNDLSDSEPQPSKAICEEANSTQSSQSHSPMPLQQVQQPSFIPSAQALFILNPIVPLPAFQSTSINTTQMTLALMQAKKQVKLLQRTSQNLNESNVQNGSTNREWLESYWKQERERYQNPLQPYTFTCIDGTKVTVGPVTKKLISGVSQRPRQHELLKNERPTYVTILSLVRDASARLPKGFGTRADIVNLVKDSQYINENLAEEKMSSIISGALDRLHQSVDPCVKYDQEKKIWIYLHHDRDSNYPDWQLPTPAKNASGKKKGKNMGGNESEF